MSRSGGTSSAPMSALEPLQRVPIAGKGSADRLGNNPSLQTVTNIACGRAYGRAIHAKFAYRNPCIPGGFVFQRSGPVQEGPAYRALPYTVEVVVGPGPGPYQRVHGTDLMMEETLTQLHASTTARTRFRVLMPASWTVRRLGTSTLRTTATPLVGSPAAHH